MRITAYFNYKAFLGIGRIRLTDFNVAIELKEGELATSMSGTIPYIGKITFF